VFGRRAADNHEDLRGIINSGHQRNRPYVRWDMMTRKPEHCPTFAMAALASIGDLPDTIMDRAVVIRMRRRAPGEQVDPYRTRRDSPQLHVLRDWLDSWLRGALDALAKAVPPMPVEDRAADTYEPLVAVADLAREDWPARARRAVRALVGAEMKADAEGNLGMRILADIRDLFEAFTTSFVASPELVMRLRKIDDAPWQHRDLNTAALAKILRPYGIRPGHNSTRTARGYDQVRFEDAFSRYLSSVPVQPSVQGPDLQEPTDGSEPMDGSTRPSFSTRPEVSAGQRRYADDWTGTDGPTPESWPEGSIGDGSPEDT
jgi:Protein of unknown function (DUF3631)